MQIIKEKTVAFTGHRILKKDIDIKDLKYCIDCLIKGEKDTFLIGMAIGFDFLCFKVLLEFKKIYKNIKIIACVPCENQDKNWNLSQKIEYKSLIKKADEIIYTSKEYHIDAMFKRNRFMVDNSSVLVAYIYKTTGGAYYTAKYAIENQKEVLYIK